MLNISKALPIIKWAEYFAYFLHRNVGERRILLYYFIRESDTVPGVAPPMIRGKSYSEYHGSVERERIMISSNIHPNFKEYHSKLYYYIYYKTRTTSYDESIKSDQKPNNGRDTFIALVAQYAVENKWQKLLKYSSNILHNRRWSVHGAFTLENYILVHCNL